MATKESAAARNAVERESDDIRVRGDVAGTIAPAMFATTILLATSMTGNRCRIDRGCVQGGAAEPCSANGATLASIVHDRLDDLARVERSVMRLLSRDGHRLNAADRREPIHDPSATTRVREHSLRVSTTNAAG